MFLNLKKLPAKKKQIRQIPEEAGIYVFWQKNTPIYIGKAINLRRRLDSYFAVRLTNKTRQMVGEADSISYIKVVSEIEALLLEAKLVRQFLPKYNVALKDDKHPLYILITKDKYPRVIMARKIDLEIPNKKVFGPFPSTRNLRYVVKMLREIFPFATHVPGKRACLYSQIGLCVPCPSDIQNTKDPLLKKLLTKEYLENIRNISGFLSGRIKSVRQDIEREMKVAAKTQRYEKAAEYKQKLKRIDYITTPVDSVDRFIENPNLLEDLREEELEELLNLLKPHLQVKKLERIECFDVAHLAGEFSTASMVTVTGGDADKSLYRHFRVRSDTKSDDIASLTEIAKRRENNLEKWGRPDLIIVDGGKVQAKTFWEVFEKHKISVVGLAKRFETIVIPQMEGKTLSYVLIQPKGPALALVQRIRNEAHRFARRYHHKLFKNYLLQPAKG